MSFRKQALKRILSLDLGARRTGVALSDETQTLATPFEILKRTSFESMLDRLARIVAAENVETILVGMPLSLNGEMGPQALHVAGEADRIGAHLKLPVVFWDERLSTVAAEQMLAETGRRRPARAAPARREKPTRSKKSTNKRLGVDAVVAAMILQEYLDARHAENEARDREGPSKDVKT